MRLPRPLRLLLENVAAHGELSAASAAAFARWLKGSSHCGAVPFHPARILMQDTAGVAALADLAALRDAVAARGGDPWIVTSVVPIDLVVDHSLSVDAYGHAMAAAENARLEMKRNLERYRFFKWSQNAFDRLRVIPPGNGICHQVNLEVLTRGVLPCGRDPQLIIGETLVGTDSHTTMVNALGVLGWGVGGIDAEAVALGEPLTIELPSVTACRLTGRRPKYVTATDIALAITSRLRQHGVVGHFVEFIGPGLGGLSLSDRAVIANMAPEYGATCGLFPVDERTLDYLRATGRKADHVELVEAHARATGIWRDDLRTDCYSSAVTIDLGELEPLLAGPRRPHDKVALRDVAKSFTDAFAIEARIPAGENLTHGSVVLAAITSCTNTANPYLMITAGLLARNALRAGLAVKPWVKTSLAPGSRIVADYLADTGLQPELDALGFHLVGFGCTTCVGNSGPLAPNIAGHIQQDSLITCAVLSGNRNFEARIHPDVRANYLASPPLVVAYALAGTMLKNLASEPIGVGHNGVDVFLADIWPADDEVERLVAMAERPEYYLRRYGERSMTSAEWDAIDTPVGVQFPWNETSTFMRRPPFFDASPRDLLKNIVGARALLILGDGITTDHISPIGRIQPNSPAGHYLAELGIDRASWGSYGDRRGNHEVMRRGAFSHPRLRNALGGDTEGNVTRISPGAPLTSIYDAALLHELTDTPLLIFAGRDYGAGSARDWAAKGTLLLGVRAVIATSFERIHRANLVSVGVLPLELPQDVRVADLNIDGDETFAINLAQLAGPRGNVTMRIVRPNGAARSIELVCRLDTDAEIAGARSGGLFCKGDGLAARRSAAVTGTRY